MNRVCHEHQFGIVPPGELATRLAPGEAVDFVLATQSFAPIDVRGDFLIGQGEAFDSSLYHGRSEIWWKRFAKLPTFFILSPAPRERHAPVKLTEKIINFLPIGIFARELRPAIF